MGLAGRKEKQRIPNDPRNLSWADDANKFGAAYLAKLGWSEGTGLGANADGRTTHIKVHQKLDMLGIGKVHQNSPDGIAWRQNSDFENLLRRLNAGSEETADDTGTKVEGFTKAGSGSGTENVEGKQESKKRKRDEGVDATDTAGDEVDSKEERRRKKKEKKEKRKAREAAGEEGSKKEKKKKRHAEKHAEASEAESSSATPPAPTPAPRPAVVPFRAHRARFLASKRLAATSSTAVDEILGISRSGTATPFPGALLPSASSSSDPSSLPTPSDDPLNLKLQELTTSSKSVMDYFREKLLAKSNGGTPSSSAADTPAPAASTPAEYDDYDDRPRGGLGIGAARSGLGAGPSFAGSGSTSQSETGERRGLGASPSMTAMFASATSLASSLTPPNEDDIKVNLEALEIQEVAEIRSTKGKKNKLREAEAAEEDVETVATKKEKKSKRRKDKMREDSSVANETPDESVATASKKEKRRRRSEKVSEAKSETEEEKKRDTKDLGGDVTMDGERKRKKKRRDKEQVGSKDVDV